MTPLVQEPHVTVGVACGPERDFLMKALQMVRLRVQRAARRQDVLEIGSPGHGFITCSQVVLVDAQEQGRWVAW